RSGICISGGGSVRIVWTGRFGTFVRAGSVSDGYCPSLTLPALTVAAKLRGLTHDLLPAAVGTDLPAIPPRPARPTGPGVVLPAWVDRLRPLAATALAGCSRRRRHAARPRPRRTDVALTHARTVRRLRH